MFSSNFIILSFLCYNRVINSFAAKGDKLLAKRLVSFGKKMTYIYTSKKERVTIDEQDLGFLSQFAWYLDTKGYAKTAYRCVENGKRQKHVFLHHFVLSNRRKENLCVDHINQNPLDNRGSNLRYATYAQNRLNTSKTKGINYEKGKWRARIYHQSKHISLGSFKTKEEALEARIIALKSYF